MNLIAKIMAIMENLLKSMNKDNEQYLNLIEALRHPIGLLIKKNSVDIKVFKSKTKKISHEFEEDKYETEKAFKEID